MVERCRTLGTWIGWIVKTFDYINRVTKRFRFRSTRWSTLPQPAVVSYLNMGRYLIMPKDIINYKNALATTKNESTKDGEISDTKFWDVVRPLEARWPLHATEDEISACAVVVYHKAEGRPFRLVIVGNLEEHKGTGELLRAIKIEKANGPDLEEHKAASELHVEPPKCKKRKRSRQSSIELHVEHQQTNKVVMKPSTSKKKRKANEGMCTNPPAPLLGPLAVDMDKQAPPLKKKRLNKRDAATIPSSGSLPIDKDRQPSPGSLPVDKDKQPSPGSLPLDNNKQPSSGSLPVDKNKHPSLSKKVVRSPVLNNVVVSFLARREKRLSH
ncbi:hypothetical protein TRIUR3_32724 [Triticum urartu]|uniref:Uncharacterized protein n=1 Tax=Triticum urartu TaxID=4572 RepID=M7YYT2_TRIUA|nr:hypothetical protein TRIUR3_32724 [Triticum urartu]